jgi:hypothetical protein
VEIHALKLSVTEADLNQLAREQLSADAPVRNLRVHLETGLVRIGGDYTKLLVPIPFDTSWELSVQDRHVRVRLKDVRVIGLPAGIFRGTIMAGFGRLAAREAGIRLDNDTVVVDVDTFFKAHGVLLRTNLKSIHCSAGVIVLEV